MNKINNAPDGATPFEVAGEAMTGNIANAENAQHDTTKDEPSKKQPRRSDRLPFTTRDANGKPKFSFF